MKKVNINFTTEKKNYPVFIGQNIIDEIETLLDWQKYSRAVIVTDKNIGPLWLGKLKSKIPLSVSEYIVEPGEKNKNITSLERIWQTFIANKMDRKSVVINLGGGVIGDMGGFAAATYMRGIDFIQIPTSLLSMVDASAGGKLAIDYEGYKNIIGSFAQPSAVIVDVDVLESLPKRDFVSGFAEIIKHGLIDNEEYFDKVTAKKPNEFSKTELIEIIEESVSIKARIVETDEKETGLRKILNFGHTIGHAIESIKLNSKNPLLHGEAVAIGMIAEAKLSELSGYIEPEDFHKVERAMQNAGLPVKTDQIDPDKILKVLKFDKKNEKGKVKWTLLKKIGEADFNIEIDLGFATKAINYILN